MRSRNVAISVTVLSHFTVAFVVLGMAPFYPIILQKSLHYTDLSLAGFIYALPVFLTALCSPLWGRFADHFGKKISLLRALLGLSLAFLLAGYSTTATLYCVALIIQGMMGGTMSAANAYMATLVSGVTLSRCLTLLQASARCSFLIAPIVFGYGMSLQSPISIYRYMALIPICVAALLLLANPATLVVEQKTCEGRISSDSPKPYSVRDISITHCIFAFATVITYPYFILFIQSQLHCGYIMAGFLFGLPHVIYLFVARKASLFLEPYNPRLIVSLSFVFLSMSIAFQVLTHAVAVLILLRVVMGLSILMSYIALHGMLSHVAQPKTSGKLFSWFDMGSKLGGVAAGLLSGVLVHYSSLAMPFWLGAVVAAFGALWMFIQYYYSQKIMLIKGVVS